MFSEEGAKRRVILRPLSNNGSRKKLVNGSVGIYLRIASEGKFAVSKDISNLINMHRLNRKPGC